MKRDVGLPCRCHLSILWLIVSSMIVWDGRLLTFIFVIFVLFERVITSALVNIKEMDSFLSL